MRRAIPLLALLTVLAAAPASAARPLPLLPPSPRSHLMPGPEHGKPVEPEPFFRSGFVVEAAHGYKVGVSTEGGAVVLQVWRGHKGMRTMTSYMARGVARPNRLQATFGRFGKVKMRFRPSRNRSWFGNRRTCRGANRFVKRRGTFRGNLRFRGERGYVSLRLHRAKGAVVTEAPKCLHRRVSGFIPGFGFYFRPLSALLSISRDGIDTSALIALEGKKTSFFGASAEDTPGKLAIVRLAFLAEKSPIHTNEHLTAAELSPPAPFHGTGRYRAYPDGTNSWAGSLSVDFPGAPRFPLTGPSWEAFLEVPF
jgi:hypothetical protein